MRIVVSSCYGTQGDVNPLVDIACELQAQGHAVQMVTDGYFGERCRALGLNVITIGSVEEYEAILANAEERVKKPETLVYHWLSRLKQHFEVSSRVQPYAATLSRRRAGRRDAKGLGQGLTESVSRHPRADPRLDPSPLAGRVAVGHRVRRPCT